MATIPTSEEVAKQIISIFVHEFNQRPGEVLTYNNFFKKIDERTWTHSDFKKGLDYAAKQGWIEILESGDSFRLTELGFEIVGTVPNPEYSGKKVGAVIGTTEEQGSLPETGWFVRQWKQLACIGGILLGLVTFMVQSELATKTWIWKTVTGIIDTFLRPNPHGVTAKISLIDDEAKIFMNGREALAGKWGIGDKGTPIGHKPGHTGTVDVTDYFHKGDNEVRFWLWNEPIPGGVSAKFEISANGKLLLYKYFYQEDSTAGVKFDETYIVILDEAGNYTEKIKQ